MILNEFLESFIMNSSRNAFCIDEHFYTYKNFLGRVNAIRNIIEKNIPEAESNVAIIANDDLDTYASIFALWFEGKT